MPSTCPHCGIGFNLWGDYHEHLKTHQHKNFKPYNHTGRSKAEIVDAAERTWLLSHLVVKPACGADCKCFLCQAEYIKQMGGN